MTAKKTKAAPVATVEPVAEPASVFTLAGQAFAIRPDFTVTMGREFVHDEQWRLASTMNQLIRADYLLLKDAAAPEDHARLLEALGTVVEFDQVREAVNGLFQAVAARPSVAPPSS